jgi:hypothetical protein
MVDKTVSPMIPGLKQTPQPHPTVRTRAVGSGDHKTDIDHHMFCNTSILANKSKTHEVAHNGSKCANMNWEDRFSQSMLWKPFINFLRNKARDTVQQRKRVLDLHSSEFNLDSQFTNSGIFSVYVV